MRYIKNLSESEFHIDFPKNISLITGFNIIPGILRETQGDTELSDSILKSAIEAILQFIRLDWTMDIPYVAGYSEDGQHIYIDKDCPKKYEKIDLKKTLVVHEATEIAVLSLFKLEYKQAHQIALRVEKALVEAYGYNWEDYNKFFEPIIKKIGDKKLVNVPQDLDLQPYEDEHDEKELDALRKVMKSIPDNPKMQESKKRSL
jgi:hypothetical protein